VMVKTGTVQVSTRGNADVQDITTQISRVLRGSGLKDGTLTVFCPSATSAVTTLEYESGCVSDLRRLFDEITAPDREYAHNARWGDGNGHSHVRAALLGPSLTVPFVDGDLCLGTWQQVIYVDFDTRPRDRELVVQMIGE
jgi:secondary thiamine-phosphate synthase enzyme